MPPRYTEWLTYLFDHEYPAGYPEWFWQADGPVFEATAEEYADLWIATLKHCSTDLTAYTDEQVGNGLMFLFSNGCSDHSLQIMHGDLGVPKMVEVYESFHFLYRDLFRVRCSETLGHLSEPGSALNTICYMLWDISPLGYLDEECPLPVRKALFRVLADALDLPHRACIESALHGLGELACLYPDEVQSIIEEKLPAFAHDEALKAYALNASSGYIQ